MKKTVSILFAGIAAIVVSACGGNAEPAAEETPAAAEEAAAPEAGHDMMGGGQAEGEGGEEVTFEAGEGADDGLDGTGNPAGPVTAPAPASE